MKIACIGARDTPPDVLLTMERIGKWLSSIGHIVASGNADGADYAFARGANSVDPKLVQLFLPWNGHNPMHIVYGNIIVEAGGREGVDNILEVAHPIFLTLKDSVKRLHRRNYSIVEGASCVICYTKNGKDIGGTGVGIRLAEQMGIPVFNLFGGEAVKKEIFEYILKKDSEAIKSWQDLRKNGGRNLEYC